MAKIRNVPWEAKYAVDFAVAYVFQKRIRKVVELKAMAFCDEVFCLVSRAEWLATPKLDG